MPFEFESLQSMLELYDSTADAHGHDPSEADHVLAVLAHVSSDRETAQEEIIDRLAWFTKEGDKASLTVDMLRNLPNYRHHYTAIQAAVNRGEGSVEGVVRKLLDTSAVGSAEQCIDCLRRVRRATRIRNFAFGFESLLDRDRIVAVMDRFATEVLPYV
jgi:alkanesulfonate monooxygenase SsuD/methylene tetrahydromethanopterin reductase-like flavin-dependent oxidoreductase (luciferase family)